MVVRILLALAVLAIPAFSQSNKLLLDTEARTRESLNQYTFKRNVVLQTIGLDGQVTGQITRNSVFVFDDQGNRVERGIEENGELKSLRITSQEWQDLRDAQLLAEAIESVVAHELGHSMGLCTKTSFWVHAERFY